MDDDPSRENVSADELAKNIRGLVQEIQRLYPPPSPTEQLLSQLRHALFGTSERSFFRGTAFRFLDRGPTGKAYRLFVKAITCKTIVDDKASVLLAVSKMGRLLQFVCDGLQNDKEICISAIENDPYAAPFIGSNLADDKEFLLSLKRMPPLARLSERLRDDPDIVQRCGELASASYRLRDDEAFIRNLIKHRPMLFRFASDRLRDDKSLVIFAFSREQALDPSLLPYVSDRLKKDPEVITAAHESSLRKAERRELSGFNRAYG